MMKEYIKTINGYEVYLEQLEEDISMYDVLSLSETGIDHSATFEAVRREELKYFCARVVVVKCEHGNVLKGEDYLGCCFYEDSEDFVKNSGYFEGMINQAIDDAIEIPLIDII